MRKLDRRIRHVGYYDGFGRILYDSIKENQVYLEGVEEMHILNGTVAMSLNLWDRELSLGKGREPHNDQRENRWRHSASQEPELLPDYLSIAHSS